MGDAIAPETTCFHLQPTGVLATKLPAPLADRLIGDDDASLGQQIFDIAEAEAEEIVEPYGVADDQRRESVTPVARFRLTREANLPCSAST